jgi:hypothetical protein
MIPPPSATRARPENTHGSTSLPVRGSVVEPLGSREMVERCTLVGGRTVVLDRTEVSVVEVLDEDDDELLELELLDGG